MRRVRGDVDDVAWPDPVAFSALNGCSAELAGCGSFCVGRFSANNERGVAGLDYEEIDDVLVDLCFSAGGALDEVGGVVPPVSEAFYGDLGRVCGLEVGAVPEGEAGRVGGGG